MNLLEEPCLILGDFCNWRPVIGRKVLQLTIEVPIEQTKDVLNKLGSPQPGQSLWVAVARLDEKAREPLADARLGRKEILPTSSSSAARSASGSPIPSKEKRRFEDLPLSQQCALRCQDKEFSQFINRKGWHSDGETVEEWVRAYCKMDSRSALDSPIDFYARHRWKIGAELGLRSVLRCLARYPESMTGAVVCKPDRTAFFYKRTKTGLSITIEPK